MSSLCVLKALLCIHSKINCLPVLHLLALTPSLAGCSRASLLDFHSSCHHPVALILEVWRVGVNNQIWCFQKLTFYLAPVATLQPKLIHSLNKENIQRNQDDYVFLKSLTPFIPIWVLLEICSFLCAGPKAFQESLNLVKLWTENCLLEIISIVERWNQKKKWSSFVENQEFFYYFLGGGGSCFRDKQDL